MKYIPATEGAGTKKSLGLGKILIGGLGGFLLLMLAVILSQPEALLRATQKVEAQWGGEIYGHDRNLAEKWSVMIGAYLRNSGNESADVPKLVIDVPFKGMRKIFQKREQALQAGHLVQGDDDFVSGSIRLEGETIPIKLRLKGDWTDHLLGRKWSFRIRTKDGAEVFGMRRFSIQNPNTRGYQGEPMFFALMNEVGILAPRYKFVDVTINGEPVGLMAVEEFFAKELLEHNRRREGVIIRLDESLVWQSRDSLAREVVGFSGVYDNYRNARIDAIGSSKVAESPVLSEQYEAAAGLLRGFIEGRLDASEVFDVTQLGRFLAVSDAMGAWHAVRWMNMRFYYNPITARLEPIAYDATLPKRFSDDSSILNNEPIVSQMLSDPAVWGAYIEGLSGLYSLSESNQLQQYLRDVEDQHYETLRSEFRLLGRYPLDYLQPRIASLYQRMSASNPQDINNRFIFAQHEMRLYPKLAHFDLNPERTALSVESAIPFTVEFLEARWVNSSTGEQIPVLSDELPAVFAPRGLDTVGETRSFELESAPEGPDWRFETVSSIKGRPWNMLTVAGTRVDPKDRPIIPRRDVEALLEEHPFVEVDQSNRRVRIPGGTWKIDSNLIVPDGFGLDIGQGTTLQFSPQATLVVRGDVQWLGTEDNPIELVAADDRWPGLAVMNASTRSSLEHVKISSTSGVGLSGWRLTGGVNFYASDVDLAHCEFRSSFGEDALNIINSNFEIRDSLIDGTASDAFDSDFSDGKVFASTFRNIGTAGGGDAIDVSGSRIEVSNVEFEDVSDKALSIGERSNMLASQVTIQRAGTGAASKDGSTLELKDSLIKDASFAAITAYIKKPEFGTAAVEATDVRVENVDDVVLAQTGSRVVVDGRAVPTQDIDVDALYETIMRKGLQ